MSQLQPVFLSVTPKIRHMCWDCHDVRDWLFTCKNCRTRLCLSCVDDDLVQIVQAYDNIEPPIVPQKETDPFVCFDCFRKKQDEQKDKLIRQLKEANSEMFNVLFDLAFHRKPAVNEKKECPCGLCKEIREKETKK